MKIRTIGFAILATVGLSACAGSGSRHLARSETQIDYGKVVAVNDWALQRGAKVMWINYPVRAKGDKAGEG